MAWSKSMVVASVRAMAFATAVTERVVDEGDVITAADLFLRDAPDESVVDGVAPLPPLLPTGVTSHRITLHGRRGSL